MSTIRTTQLCGLTLGCLLLAAACISRTAEGHPLGWVFGTVCIVLVAVPLLAFAMQFPSQKQLEKAGIMPEPVHRKSAAAKLLEEIPMHRRIGTLIVMVAILPLVVTALMRFNPSTVVFFALCAWFMAGTLLGITIACKDELYPPTIDGGTE